MPTRNHFSSGYRKDRLSLPSTSIPTTSSTRCCRVFYPTTTPSEPIMPLPCWRVSPKSNPIRTVSRAFRQYFNSTAIDQLFAGGSAQQDANTTAAWQRARMSYFGRAAYNYKEKYLAEFLWRYDGSYMFPRSSRWGFFPGVTAGWRISEEDFFKKTPASHQFAETTGIVGSVG